MSFYPLDKIRKILDYWVELTLPPEAREKRMREKADEAAQKVFESLYDTSSLESLQVIDSENNHGDTQALDRFLSLIN